MIEQISNAITFYAHFIESKLGKTGLTVTVDVWRGSDATEIVTAASAVELGDGLYKYTLAGGSTGTESEYLAVFKTTTTTVDQQHIPAIWVVGKGGLEHLVTGGVTVTSTVASSGDLALVRGDDYFEADSRELSFTSTGWPDLTGATAIKITGRARTGPTIGNLWFGVNDKSGSRVTGGGSQTVVFELATTDTVKLVAGTGSGKYDVQATLASGRIVTLTFGQIDVTEDQTK